MTPPHESLSETPDLGDLKIIMFRLDKLEEGLAGVQATQSAILDELRRVPRCPSPGLCLNTQKDVEANKKTIADLTAKVDALEKDRARIEGAQWAGKVVWTIIGFLFSSGAIGLVYTLIQLAGK